MIDSDHIDDTLRALGGQPLELPPLSDDLERELGELQPTKPRSPVRQLLAFAVVSLAVASGILALLTLRKDLTHLPRLWMVVYCTGWLLGFVGLGMAALLPRSGQVSPSWRLAGFGAIAAGAAFVTAGLVFARDVPGLSVLTPANAHDFAVYGQPCLRMGVITAIVPVGLGALFLRGAVPVGDRWVAAGLGASGGALGGLMLHLHCPIADPWHLGLVHGGVVVVSALLSALIVPRFLRP